MIIFCRAFEEHFPTCDKTDVVTFPNLGGDALLVVPCPVPQNGNKNANKQLDKYSHLANFMAYQNGNWEQKHNLLIAIANAVEKELKQLDPNQPLWLSTCGTGIYWLHVRLDSRPKYYSFQDYRNFINSCCCYICRYPMLMNNMLKKYHT